MTSIRRPHAHTLLPCLCGIFCLSTLSEQAALPATPDASASRNRPDAFLPLPASNIEGVLEQVQSDPAVRRHYAHYFHMPQSRVAPYLRANLVPSRLRRGGLYTVYFVRANGLIYPTLLTLHAGIPVFALRNGPPVLTWNEGDPLAAARRAVPLGAIRPVARPKPVAPPESQPPPLQVIVPNHAETTVVPPTAPPVPPDAVPAAPATP